MLTLPYRLFPLLQTSSTEGVQRSDHYVLKLSGEEILNSYHLRFPCATLSSPHCSIASTSQCYQAHHINYNFSSLSLALSLSLSGLFTLSSGAKKTKRPHPSPNKPVTCISPCILFIKRFLETDHFILFFILFHDGVCFFILHTQRHSQKTIVHFHELNSCHLGIDALIIHTQYSLLQNTFFLFSLLSRFPLDS